jgi:hypothetical protein
MYMGNISDNKQLIKQPDKNQQLIYRALEILAKGI